MPVLTRSHRFTWVDGALCALMAGCVVALAVLGNDPSWRPVFVGVAIVQCALLVPLWWRDTLTMRHVLILAVVFRLVFLPLLPGLSDDMYRYIWDGLVQVEGINPYLYQPSDAVFTAWQDSALYNRLNSAEYYSVYPPVSQLVFAVGGLFYEYGWEGSYYVIKGLFMLMEVGGLLILARCTDARLLILYAWHPLVLVETAGQAHTEAALVLFLALAVWAVRQGRGRWASVALAGASMVKLYPFVLFPLLWRRFGWAGLWPGAAVCAALALPYAHPEVPGHVMASLGLYVELFEFNAGLYYAVKDVLLEWTGQDWSKTIGPVFRRLFFVSLPLLYVVDAVWRPSFARASIWVLGAFFVFSTTVHPWYLLAVLPLTVVRRSPSWAWLWLSAFSLGSYLLYTGGPYWLFVNIAWGGFFLIGTWQVARSLPDIPNTLHGLLQRVQQRRARAKFVRIRPWLDALWDEKQQEPEAPQRQASLRVLDLGAGEGYVGAEIADRIGASVVLADVLDMNQTTLDHVRYDGEQLPFGDDAFDVTILYFVLHHAREPDRVLAEALRVSARGVIVVESVVTGSRQEQVLRWVDTLANRLRSGGQMNAQEEHLNFRTAEAWKQAAHDLDAHVAEAKLKRHPIHPQLFMMLSPSTRTVTKNQV